MGPACADYDSRSDRFHLAVRVCKFDRHSVGTVLDLRRGDPTLDRAAERHEMPLKDPLSLVLRKTALEFATAIEAIVTHRADHAHLGPVQARAMDALGRFEERRQQTDTAEDFKRARLNRCRAGFVVRSQVALDESSSHAVPRKLCGSEQPGRPGPDDQDVVWCVVAQSRPGVVKNARPKW
jgi:hypothetical protein